MIRGTYTCIVVCLSDVVQLVARCLANLQVRDRNGVLPMYVGYYIKKWLQPNDTISMGYFIRLRVLENLSELGQYRNM